MPVSVLNLIAPQQATQPGVADGASLSGTPLSGNPFASEGTSPFASLIADQPGAGATVEGGVAGLVSAAAGDALDILNQPPVNTLATQAAGELQPVEDLALLIPTTQTDLLVSKQNLPVQNIADITSNEVAVGIQATVLAAQPSQAAALKPVAVNQPSIPTPQNPVTVPQASSSLEPVVQPVKQGLVTDFSIPANLNQKAPEGALANALADKPLPVTPTKAGAIALTPNALPAETPANEAPVAVVKSNQQNLNDALAKNILKAQKVPSADIAQSLDQDAEGAVSTEKSAEQKNMLGNKNATKPEAGVLSAALNQQLAQNNKLQNISTQQLQQAVSNISQQAQQLSAESGLTQGDDFSHTQQGSQHSSSHAAVNVGNESQRLASQETSFTRYLGQPHPPVAEQMLVNIRNAIKNGNQQFSIRLEPAELGRVDVRMDINPDGQTRIAVTAETKDALELLQRDARGLEKALQDLGFKTDQGSLAFNLRGESQTGEQGQSNSHNKSSAGTNFMMDEMEELSAREQEYQHVVSGGYSLSVEEGLDLKI